MQLRLLIDLCSAGPTLLDPCRLLVERKKLVILEDVVGREWPLEADSHQ